MTQYASNGPEVARFCCSAHINWLDAALTCWMLILILMWITLRAPTTMKESKSKRRKHSVRFEAVSFAVVRSFEAFVFAEGNWTQKKENRNEEINEMSRLFANDCNEKQNTRISYNFIARFVLRLLSFALWKLQWIVCYCREIYSHSLILTSLKIAPIYRGGCRTPIAIPPEPGARWMKRWFNFKWLPVITLLTSKTL